MLEKQSGNVIIYFFFDFPSLHLYHNLNNEIILNEINKLSYYTNELCFLLRTWKK